MPDVQKVWRLLPADVDGANRLAIARPQSNPLVEWKSIPVSAPGDVKIVNFYHGLGVGDINKDGHNDILVPNGWWEGPAESTNDPWTFHAAPFGAPQSQMYVYDFDGDGDNDVVGSSAHRRGILAGKEMRSTSVHFVR